MLLVKEEMWTPECFLAQTKLIIFIPSLLPLTVSANSTPSPPVHLRHHTLWFLIGNRGYCLTSPHSQFSVILHKFLSILSPTHLWNLVTSFNLHFPSAFKSSGLLVYSNSLWICAPMQSIPYTGCFSDLICFSHLSMY